MSKSSDDPIKIVEEMAYLANRLLKNRDAMDIIPYFIISTTIDTMIACLWGPGNYNSMPPRTKEFISKIVALRADSDHEIAKITRKYLNECKLRKKYNLNDD